MADYVSKYLAEEIEKRLDKAGQIETIIAKQTANKADKSIAKTVTLTASAWSNNAQTVSVSGVTTANNVIISPATKASADIWAESEVFCTAQGNSTLKFTCTDVPTSNITVSVVIIG